MRDPRRICLMTSRLNRLWELVPDMRFGQLVECIQAEMDGPESMFYAKDVDWDKAMGRMLVKHNKKRK